MGEGEGEGGGADDWDTEPHLRLQQDRLWH